MDKRGGWTSAHGKLLGKSQSALVGPTRMFVLATAGRTLFHPGERVW